MLIAGVDEVGRGCLAGPVVACALIMPSGFYDSRIKDSKKLSKMTRERLTPFILTSCVSFGIGVVCSAIIDKINILNATKQAMQIALSRLDTACDKIIVDSVSLKNIDTDMIHPDNADNDFIEVAAASIIAKVYRDNLMLNLSRIYPQYLWQKNAGYGTAAHIDAINSYGVTPIHRATFLKNII